MYQSTFFVKTLLGQTLPVTLSVSETCPAAVLEEILEQVPVEYRDSRIICAGKNLLDCVDELSHGVDVYFGRLAAIYIIANAPKRRHSALHSSIPSCCSTTLREVVPRPDDTEVNRLKAALVESEGVRAAMVDQHREEKAKLLEKIGELNHIAERRSRISGVLLSKKPVGKKVFAPEDF